MSIKERVTRLLKGFRPPNKDITELWKLFESGKNHNNVRNLKNDCERAQRFYEGDQWHGLEVDHPERTPYQNFIAPTINHKLANVCMNEMAVVFDGDDSDLCSLITEKVGDVMKKIRVNQAGWDATEAALITGNGYIFFPCGDICVDGAKIRGHKTPWQLIDSPCIFFGDEQSADIQSQPYIIIYERRNVEDVRKMAEKNGVPEEELLKIVKDEEEELLITTDVEEELTTGTGKCSSIIYMEKKDGVLYVARSTRHVIYEPLHPVCGGNELQESAAVGMDMYPIVGMSVGLKKNSSRGVGEVLPMIPNQIEYNKNLVRIAATVKNTSYPKMAYAKDMVENPSALEETGSMIAVDSDRGINDILKAIGYIQPAAIGGDAFTLGNILKDGTRELMNAGQAVTGEINPEKASGSAIIAMRDQAAIPLNKLQSSFKKMYADIGLVLFHYLIAYNPTGLNIAAGAETEAREIGPEELQAADLSINVEVTSIAPYSIFARDSALEKLMQAGAITFEEYVEALDENSTVPKKVLDKLLKKREQLRRAQEAQAVVDEIRGEDEENALMAGIAEKRVAEVLSGEGQPQGGLEEELENIMGGGEVNE